MYRLWADLPGNCSPGGADVRRYHRLRSLRPGMLLFDGDFGLANVDIQLGLMAEKDLGTVISGKSTLNQAIQHNPDTKFDVLAGRSGSGSLANVPLGRLQILGDDLKIASSSYDKVILRNNFV